MVSTVNYSTFANVQEVKGCFDPLQLPQILTPIFSAFI